MQTDPVDDQASDWGALPIPVLVPLIRSVLEGYDSVADIVAAFQDLALVNKHWLAAARATPLCLGLSSPAHLSAAAQRWLARNVLEVLIIRRGLYAPDAPSPPSNHGEGGGGGASDAGSDGDGDAAGGEAPAAALPPLVEEVEQPFRGCLDLLEDPDFLRNSGHVLSSLVNAPLGAELKVAGCPQLRQLALHGASRARGEERVCVAALAPLPLLSCLTLSGHFALAPADWAALPPALRHLSISNYGEGGEGLLAARIPPTLTRLKYLSLKSEAVFLDWADVAGRCAEVHLAGEALLLGLGAGEPLPPAEAPEASGAFARRFASLLAGGELALERASLTFGAALCLWAQPDSSVQMEPNAFMAALRQLALPLWDLKPAITQPASFLGDRPAPGQCFVLGLDRQEGPAPRSYHFSTPITPSELQMLLAHPAWRLAWCPDPAAAAVLRDPLFLASHAATLARLSGVDLPPGVDLRPLAALRSLGATLMDGRLSGVRLPRGLTSLDLEAADDPDAARRFSAAALAGLTALRDLGLSRFRRHDLVLLPPGVTSLRISNPCLGAQPDGYPEVFDSRLLRLPAAAPAGAARGLGARVLRLLGLGGGGQGGAAWSDDEEAPVAAQQRRVDEAAAAAAAAAVAASASGQDASASGALAPGDGAAGSEAPVARRRRRQPRHRHVDDGLEGGGGGGGGHPGDDGSDEEEEEEDAAAAEHARHACDDPHCPVHSGKRHLHLSFTDPQDCALDLLELVNGSGFPMVTISFHAHALDEDGPEPALRLVAGNSWQGFMAGVQGSPSLEVLEINTHASPAFFERAAPRGGVRTFSTLLEGLLALQERCGDDFEFKSWDGESSREGVQPGEQHGYALVRRVIRGGGGGGGGGSGGQPVIPVYDPDLQ